MLLILGAGCWLAFDSMTSKQNTSKQAKTVSTRVVPQPDPSPPNDTEPTEQSLKQGALELAMKTITLSQGEGGFELWRLKAEWASLHKQEDSILVEQPRLTYFMKDDGKNLYVQSVRGDVNQKTQILRFVDDVQVSQDAKHLKGALLVYNGNEKTMTLPQGAVFADNGIEGTADFLVWHIDHKFIEATGNIRVDFEVASPEIHSLPFSEQQPDSNTDGPKVRPE